MAIYYSPRAAWEAVGSDPREWTQKVSDGWKASDKVGGSAKALAAEVSGEISGAREMSRSLTDSELISELCSHILAPVKNLGTDPRDISLGDFVFGKVMRWKQGCVPIFAVNNQSRYGLTMYMAEGVADLRAGESRWKAFMRRIRRSEPRQMVIKSIGSADNYEAWNQNMRNERTNIEGYYPSSVEGMMSVLAPDVDVLPEDVAAEIENDLSEMEDESFLCRKFDWILGSRFHNNQKSGRESWQIDLANSLQPNVRILGCVRSIAKYPDGRAAEILVRPVIIS